MAMASALTTFRHPQVASIHRRIPPQIPAFGAGISPPRSAALLSRSLPITTATATSTTIGAASIRAPLLVFASMSTVSTPLTVVASGMAKWLELYSAVLMIRVLLSWFPNIPWERQPFMAIRDMCDPYLNLFRNIIPPLFNALDLSPLLAFMVLGTLSAILNMSTA